MAVLQHGSRDEERARCSAALAERARAPEREPFATRPHSRSVVPARGRRRSPHGFLRLLVVFHESEALGAGRSVLNAMPPLEAYGWTVSGWFPGQGPLLDELRARSSSVGPTARSRSATARADGAANRASSRACATRRHTCGPSGRRCSHARPHVVHANTLRTLPEARVARSLGLPVVAARARAAAAQHEADAYAARRGENRRRPCRGLGGCRAKSCVRTQAGTPVLVAHNGVHARRRPRVRPATPATVGTIGTVCRTKGTDRLPRGGGSRARRCPDLRFEHVGQSGLDDDVEFERQLSELASPSGAAGRRRVARRSAGGRGARGLGALRPPVAPGRVPARDARGDGGRGHRVAADVGGVGRADRAPRERHPRRRQRARRPLLAGSSASTRDTALRERLARAASARVATALPSIGRPLCSIAPTWPRSTFATALPLCGSRRSRRCDDTTSRASSSSPGTPAASLAPSLGALRRSAEAAGAASTSSSSTTPRPTRRGLASRQPAPTDRRESR